MTTYLTPGKEQHEALQTALKKYHPRLIEAKTTICMLVVFAEIDEHGEPVGQALNLHGTPAYAVTRIFPLKLRAHGLADAEILVDGERWKDMPNKTRIALLDHELTHIDLVFKDNVLQVDDLGRAKLTMRHHDYTHGWFTEVVERHGKASIESLQARRFVDESGQLYLDFTTKAAANG